jgi:3-deoxy-D-manno-octulosonic-acid transferase
MRLLYNLGIYIYYALIFIFSFFNAKAKRWWDGRKNLFSRYEALKLENTKIVWFHAASLGEFEQGRPVLEKFKYDYPEYKILLTFFSPSGYEVRKNYPLADFIFYLPMDTPYIAKRFIEIFKPELVFFIKYEFWFNLLRILKEKNITVYLISGIFRPQQHFFAPYGGWFRKGLKCFSHFFVQHQSSKDLLESIGLKNVTISGDTRFDRVTEIAANKKSFPLILKFKGCNQILLAGSSWEEDESFLLNFIHTEYPDLKYIIAPHEIDSERIQQLQKNLSFIPTLLFSEANDSNIKEAKVLIIDNIGTLSHLYQYATIALIGGGFGKGIHNILEAATFGNPILFGPNYEKFTEAVELIKLEGAFEFIDYEDFKAKIHQLLEDKNYLEKCRKICSDYVKSKKGATEIILQHLNLH